MSILSTLRSILSRLTDRATRIERCRHAAKQHVAAGKIRAAQRFHRRVLRLSPTDIDTHIELANLYELQGHLDDAHRHYGQAMDLASDDAQRAVALSGLGLVEMNRGNLDAAEDLYTRSLRIAQALDCKEATANEMEHLGVVAGMRKDFEQAERYFKEALAIHESLGNKQCTAVVFGNLGITAQARGDLESAKRYHEHALALNQELGRLEGMARQLGNLGLLEDERGDLDAAEAYHRRSLAIDERLGRAMGIAASLCNLASIAWRRNQPADARRQWEDALDIYAQCGMQRNAEEVRGWLARLSEE